MSKRGGRNLKYQALNAIDGCFKEKRDKRSDKNNKQRGTHKIYSYNDRKGLIDTSALLMKWAKENHPEIKMLSDFRTSHYQQFIADSSSRWSKKTQETHISHLHKLDKIFSHTYKAYEEQLADQRLAECKCKTDTKIKDVAMNRSDWKKLRDYGATMRSKAALTAIEVAGRVGLRVNECAKLKGSDYNEKTGQLYVAHSKGGRERTIEVKEEHRAYFKELKEQYGDARVCPAQSGSLNRTINRWMKNCGLEAYIEADANVHAIRKMVAQEMYDEQKALGKVGIEAFNPVSDFLGHGDERYELFKAYILRP